MIPWFDENKHYHQIRAAFRYTLRLVGTAATGGKSGIIIKNCSVARLYKILVLPLVGPKLATLSPAAT
jgi:hypothetical protein